MSEACGDDAAAVEGVVDGVGRRRRDGGARLHVNCDRRVTESGVLDCVSERQPPLGCRLGGGHPPERVLDMAYALAHILGKRGAELGGEAARGVAEYRHPVQMVREVN